MKVGDLREMLKGLDDHMDIVVVERPMAGAEDVTPVRFEVHANRWRVEAVPEDRHYALEARRVGDDFHCCTECEYWSVMDGRCSVDGKLYHGWEKACDWFAPETDTR